MADERARKRDALRLASLLKNENVMFLLEQLDAKAGRMHIHYAARLAAGEELNQRQIDYDRGFADALRSVRKTLEGAEAKTIDTSEPESDHVEEGWPAWV